jgi:transcriptional regulator with XRE-family HTH domain
LNFFDKQRGLRVTQKNTGDSQAQQAQPQLEQAQRAQTARNLAVKNGQAEDATKMLGEVISRLRFIYGLTISGLAKEAGVSDSYVSDIETGREMLSPGMLPRFASAFDMDTSTLMYFSKEAGRKGVNRQQALFEMLRIVLELANDREDDEDDEWD